MTTFASVFNWRTALNLSKLQRIIIERTDHGTMRYSGYDTEITASLAGVARAIESAYVLTAKDELPKITHSTATLSKRMFTFAGDPFVPYSTDPNHTSERARQTAAKWLAIAGHLEGEEKTKAAEAKKAVTARTARLNELASEYFATDFFSELGERKARVIEELYRVEQKLEELENAA